MAINEEKEPYFSIIIPTKNRSHIVGYAVQSVLNQSFGDFEVVIVDNDDTEATYKVVQKFNDHRIRYIRTGGLSMVENWRSGLHQIRGRYVTVLQDKQAYYEQALEVIHGVTLGNNIDVVIWNGDVYDDTKELAYTLVDPANPKVNLITTESILETYVANPKNAWGHLPRLINSCISRNLIEKARQRFNLENFCIPFNPDLNSAFLALASTDQVGLIENSLVINGYMSLSNVIRWRRGDSQYMGISHIEKDADLGISNMRLVNNTVYNDYLRLRRLGTCKLAAHEMSPQVYALMCADDAGRLPLGRISALKEVLAYAKNKGVPARQCVWVWLLAILKSWLLDNIGLHRFKAKKKWHANNILEAVLNRPRPS
jgi:glycosyltransferase involved in cell wall biosynthesis